MQQIEGVMQATLRKTYFRFLVPALIGFGVVYLLKQSGIVDFDLVRQSKWFVVFVFVLSLGTAIAAPILLRSHFAHYRRDRKEIVAEDFLQFERRLIRVALLSPYFSLIAYLFDFPEFYLAVVFLAALYSVYYFYPSRRRIAFEKRIFRVQ